MYDAILAPTDGSETAGKAVREAAELARTFDATLHVIYVVDVDQKYPLAGSTDLLEEGLRAEATDLFESIAAEAPDVDLVTSIEAGAPAGSILEYVERNDVDLIVIGTHGRSGIDRYLLGSVTQRVTRQAPCSVLVSAKRQRE